MTDIQPDLAIPDLALPDLSTGMDVRGIDSRLQRINGISSTWSLPELPDTVKLDLASDSEFDDDGVNEFLYGLESDLRATTNPRQVPPSISSSQWTDPSRSDLNAAFQQQAPPPPNTLFYPEDDWTHELRRLWAGVAGVPAPKRVSLGAVQDFKTDAIGRGLLPADTPIDGTWRPEFNSVRGEMAEEDFRRTISGDRPLSLSVDSTLQMINRWATPSGLIGVAMTLDFLPDPRAIKREFSGWGDKFRSWWKDKGDPRKFIDAVTGPIDDVVFPIVNTALLFSGFGNVVTFGRALTLSDDVVRAARGFSSIDDLVRGTTIAGRAVRAADVTSDVARFRRASWLATKLQATHHSAALRRTGHLMEAWRQQTGVMLTKKAIQQTMRLGFVGNVENLLLPGHEGIGLFGSGTQGERIVGFESWVNRGSQNPWVAGALTLGEAALTPPSIFHEGAFVNPVTDVWARTQRRLFGLSRDKKIATMFSELGLNRLELDDPARAARLRDLLRRGDSRRVLADIYGNGHLDTANEQLAYLIYAAGLRGYSTREALRVLGTASGTQFDRVRFGFRNQLINMIRGADNIDLSTPEGIDLYAAMRSKVIAVDEAPRQVQKARAANYRKIREVLGDSEHPDHAAWLREAQEELEHHADVRLGAFTDLLDSVTPEDVAEVIADAWDHRGNWETFKTALHRLQERAAFDDVTIRSIPKAATGDFTHNLVAEELGGKLMGIPGKRPGWWDNAKLQLAEGRGRLTVARLDAVTAQDAQVMLSQTGWLKARLAALGDGMVETGNSLLTEKLAPRLETFASSLGKRIDELTDSEISHWLDDLDEAILPATATTPKRKLALQWAETARWVGSHGVTPFDARHFLRRKLAAIEQADDWWARAGVTSRGSLDDKLKNLRQRIEFLAKEVDVDPALAEELRAMGYKPVFGSEFALPDDVLDLAGPLPAITAGDMRRRSLGIFVGYDRGMHDLVHDLRETRLRNLLPAVLRDERQRMALPSTRTERMLPVERELTLGTWGDRFGSSADVDEFVSTVREAVRNTLEEASSVTRRMDQNGLISSFTARMATTGLPKSIYRLNKKELKEIFGDQFSDRAYDAIGRALRLAEKTGWEYRGLQSLEDTLVANSWLRSALKGFGGHPVRHDMDDFFDRLKRAREVVAHPLEARRNLDMVSAQRLAGALRGGVAASVYNDDSGSTTPWWQAGLTGVAIGYAAPKTAARVVNPRNITRVAGMVMGRNMALAAGEDPTTAGLIGLGVGIGGTAAGARIARNATKAGGLFDRMGWFQYSKLGNRTRVLRDRVRFTLNPIWDLQRYTEGMTQSAVADLPPGVTLPITPRPMSHLLKDLEADGPFTYGPFRGADAVRAQWKDAARGIWDYDAIDSVQTWFRDHGIMGFSPLDWQAATYGQLIRQGMDQADAVDAVRKIHFFAMRRTGLESTVNFVFFPFSFQRQFLGNMAKFMSHDLGRAVVLHDSLRMYDTLSQRYDLDRLWRNHMPILTELREFNPLNFGISPGELGGVNRALVETARRLPGLSWTSDAVANAFLPQAWEIKTAEDWHALRPKVRRLLPLWREAEQLYEDAVREQWNVLTSPEHVAREEEIERGWQAHRRLQQEIGSFLEAQGLSYSTVMNRRNIQYRPFQEFVTSKRREIEDRYPAWRGERNRVAQIAQERDYERSLILKSPIEELSPPEQAMVAFEQALDQLGVMFNANMMNDGDLEGLPEDAFNLVRQTAVDLAHREPGFLTYYRTYYQRLFGPIVEDVR